MSAPGLSLIWVRKRTVAKARSWPIVTVSARAGQQPFRVAGQHEGVLT